MVVAADFGISRRARDVAARLNASLAIIEQRRIGNVDKKEALNVVGEVEGKPALIVDDEITTAGTMVNVVTAILERGATEVYACATHGVFVGPALERLSASPIKEITVTDTVPSTGIKSWTKLPYCPSLPAWRSHPPHSHRTIDRSALRTLDKRYSCSNG